MSDPTRDDDTALRHTKDVIEGRAPVDPALLAELHRTIEEHRPRVVAVCERIVRNREIAEECAHDAMLIAYRKLPEYEARSSVSTWLCGIARNVAMNRVRKHGELLNEDGVVEVLDESANVLRVLSRQEREELVWQATSVLPAEEQQVIHLRYIENLPHASIESLMGLPDGGARVLLQKSVQRHFRTELKRLLDKMGIGATTFMRTGG